MLNAEGANAFLEQNEIELVRVEWPDLHGLARGKCLSTSHFLDCLPSGVPFASIALHMDVKGDATPLPTAASKQGWPNFFAHPDLSTLHLLPHEPHTAQVLSDLFYLDGSPVTQSPRFALREVVRAFNDAGFQPIVGAEIEFYLLPSQNPLSSPPAPHQVNHLLFSLPEPSFFSDLHRYLDLVGVTCETCSAEDGPSQFEICLSPQDPLSLADTSLLVKNVVKQLAAHHSLTATFLSKPFPESAGSGFHLHQSLLSPDSQPLFSSDCGPLDFRPSGLCLNFIAGQLSLLPDACAFYLPTVNAYKRIHTRGPFPLSATWGIENRTVALRVVGDSPSSCGERSRTALRLENRLIAGEANPYLLTAVALASGLFGIQHRLQPPPPVAHNAYDKRTRAHPLPPTLRQALDCLKKSKTLPTLLPPDLIRLFLALKSQELSSFESSTTDWEKSTYLPWL